MRTPDQFRRYAVGNDGVFTRAGALANGLTARQFRTGADNGDWLRYRGVWVLATVPRSQRTVVRAALLRAGPASRLTGTTALWLYGLDVQVGMVAISVSAGTSRKVPGAVLLRDQDRDPVACLVRGMPAVSRSRAVVDALRLADEAPGRAILDEVLRCGWVTSGELADWCNRLRDCRGLTALRARLADAESGTRAESERVLARLMKAAGLRGWVFNKEIRSASGKHLAVSDCLHPDLKLVIEVDGRAWHSKADRFQRDRTRQNNLVLAGYTVLRFTWHDLTNRPGYVTDTIRTEAARLTAHDLDSAAETGRSATTIRRPVDAATGPGGWLRLPG